MSSGTQPPGVSPSLGSRLSRAGDALVAFARELQQPPAAVAFGSCLFILVSCGFVLTLERGVRAFPPPPPTKLQIRNAENISKTFSPVPPAQRAKADH